MIVAACINGIISRAETFSRMFLPQYRVVKVPATMALLQ
jgi:hypothetical protein